MIGAIFQRTAIIQVFMKGADLDIEEENHVRSIEIAMNGASLASEYLASLSLT